MRKRELIGLREKPEDEILIGKKGQAMKGQEIYCSRFGVIAVENGYLAAEQLQQALQEQVDDDLAGRHHRVIGTICFEHGWMTPAQIEEVLNLLFKKNSSRHTTAAN